MGPRRIATVHLPALPLECLFDDPSGAKAVQGELRGRPILVSVSSDAQKQGVRPGMTPSEAKARHPDLELRTRDPSLELKRLSRAAELLLGFGPHVEIGLPDLLYVEIGKSRRVLKKCAGDTEEAIAATLVKVLANAGHRATVVITRDPDTGRTLAQHRSLVAAKPPPRMKKPAPLSPLIVAATEERAALSRLPIEMLRWTEVRTDPEGRLKERMSEAIASLKLLGVGDIERLTSLPAAQLKSRFGDAGALLSQRAMAELDRPLITFTPSARIIEELDLESVVEDLEPMLFVLRRLYLGLEARLDARNLAAQAVELKFVVEPDLSRTISADAVRDKSSKMIVPLVLSFARPTRKAATMLAITREKLGGVLPGAIRAVTAEAKGTAGDRGAQLDLFNNHQKQLEEVGELVGRLRAALGDHAVFSPEILDRHRPEGAWRSRPYDVERALSPPKVERPGRASAAPAPKPEPSPRAKSPLPVIDQHLQVALPLSPEQVVPVSVLPTAPWPKPVPPRVEPLAPAPPRPLELFSRPEDATFLSSTWGPGLAKPAHPSTLTSFAARSAGGLDEGVLLWRGQRLPLVGLSARERLEAEWWTELPVDREYTIAETADGRRLWLYFTGDAAYVHGIFD